MAFEHFVTRDDGTRVRPGIDVGWDEWVSASKTRNWCLGDPLLDWLDLHGRLAGFPRDDDLPGHDPRCDFLAFILAKGRAFESRVLDHLRARHDLAVVTTEVGESRTEEAATRTWEAMAMGAEIIAEPALWNPEHGTCGMPDLLVRSDVLHRSFPRSIGPEEARIAARDLPGRPGWHYRVVDIKFATLRLLADGHAAATLKPFMAQVWVYNEALGRIQGHRPSASYLLGRGWRLGDEHGDSAMDRLARVDHDHVFPGRGGSLASLVREGCRWYRSVRLQGADWSPLPEPTVADLRPNLRNGDDQPWRHAKRRIARELEDLSLVPGVSPARRARALASGIRRWSDPRCCAESLGFAPGPAGRRADAFLEANRSPPDGPIVFPRRLAGSDAAWRAPAPAEFHVDFETVSDLDDDFSRFPRKGGLPLIFMIGTGWSEPGPDGPVWRFRTFTADELGETEERRILEEWLAFLESQAEKRGSSLGASRLFHWSPAEVAFLASSTTSAAVRHDRPDWARLPWFDLLSRVVRPGPVTVRGAWSFGLKAMTKALHQAGLVRADWPDGPTDGLGAMRAAWACHHEASSMGVPMRQLPLMETIARYNETDCRAMAEILSWLRTHR